MKSLLAQKLIEKGAIRENTVFEAYFNAPGLSCIKDARILKRFRTVSAKLSGDQTRVVLEGTTDLDTNVYRFSSEDVVSLDGMPVKRVASVYNLTESGQDIIRRRRGRKPKNHQSVPSDGTISEKKLPNPISSKAIEVLIKIREGEMGLVSWKSLHGKIKDSLERKGWIVMNNSTGKPKLTDAGAAILLEMGN